MLSDKIFLTFPVLIAAAALVMVPAQIASARDSGKSAFVHVKDGGHRGHGNHGSKHHTTRHNNAGHHNTRHPVRNHNNGHHGTRHHITGHHNTKHYYNEHHGIRHHNTRHYNRGHRNDHQRYGVINFGYGGYNRYPSFATYGYGSHGYNGYDEGKNCRSTHKYQTDRYGNTSRINGTLCYDSYGNAYIVPGSRYVADSYR